MARPGHPWNGVVKLLAACVLMCALGASAADFNQHTHHDGYHGGGAAARAVRLDQASAAT